MMENREENRAAAEESTIEIRNAGGARLSSAERREFTSNQQADFPFRCQSCSSYCRISEILVLQNCLHFVCRYCIAGLVRQSEGRRVGCPWVDGGISCNIPLQQCEMEAESMEFDIRLLATPQIHGDYLNEETVADDNAGSGVFPSSNGHGDHSGWRAHEENVDDYSSSISDIGDSLRQQDANWEQVGDEGISEEECMPLEAVVWAESNPVVLNVKPMECPLCFLIVPPLEGIILRDCSHGFCRPCIAKTICYSDKAEIRCPDWDGEYICESSLQQREIKALVDPVVFEQYLQRSVADVVSDAGDNIFHCKTPNCPGWCIHDDNVNNFLCPICKIDNCLTDQIIKEIHEGVSLSEKMSKERYEARVTLENCGIKLNTETIECPICLVTCGPQEGLVLWDCPHTFCRPCIAEAIRHAEGVQVQCPFRNNDYACTSTLQEREIKALVEPEVYQKYLAKSIIQAEGKAGKNAFHCKTPDCPGWCINDDGAAVNFSCPVCRVHNCMKCKVIHTGQSCEQYQEELRLSKEPDEAKRSEAKISEMIETGLQCPCGLVVSDKISGCDYITCFYCKTELCWATKGPRWGPRGRGDISGGCRCMVNKIPCHPSCRNCH